MKTPNFELDSLTVAARLLEAAKREAQGIHLNVHRVILRPEGLQPCHCALNVRLIAFMAAHACCHAAPDSHHLDMLPCMPHPLYFDPNQHCMERVSLIFCACCQRKLTCMACGKIHFCMQSQALSSELADIVAHLFCL